jgi:hypothetical protein
MASPRVALIALALAAAFALARGGSALAFGAAGEAEMPAEYYCLRGVYGSYVIIARAMGETAPGMFLQDEQSELVPAGHDGCEREASVERSSSSFYGGEANPAVRHSAIPAPGPPMIPVDLGYYMAIFDAQGVEAADAWARGQHYR